MNGHVDPRHSGDFEAMANSDRSFDSARPWTPGDQSITMATAATTLVRAVAVLLCYYITARLGLLIPYVGTHVSLIWLPTGVALGAYIRWGFGMVPAVLAAAFLANVGLGGPLWLAMAIAVGNSGGPLAAAMLLKHAQFDTRLLRRTDLAKFSVAVTLGMLVSSTNGAAWLTYSGLLELSHFADAWSSWWAGDSLGAVLGGIPLIAISRPAAESAFRGRLGLSTSLLQTVVLACGIAVFSTWLPPESPFLFPLLALPFFLIPLLALQGGVLASSMAVLLLSIAAAYGTSQGHGPFARHDSHSGILALWSYITAQAATALLICSSATQLQSSRRQYSALMRHVHDGILVVSSDDRLVVVNRAALELLQVRYEDVVGRPVDAFPNGNGAVLARLMHLGQSSLSETLAIHRHEGDTRKVQCQVARYLDGSHHWQTHLVLRDVTEECRQDAMLAEAQGKLKSITDNLQALIAYVDRSQIYRFANAHFQKALGVDPDTMLGKTMRDFLGEVAYRENLVEVEAALRGERQTFERAGRGANAGRYYLVDYVPDADSENKVAGFFVMVLDISERRRAEIALSHRESELRESMLLLDRTGRLAGVGGWELDLAGDVLRWTSQTRAIHEVSPDYQPTLEAALSFYAPDGRATIEREVQIALTKGCGWDVEVPLITAKGRSIWVRTTGEAVVESGKAVRMFGAIQDITERRQAERSLRYLTDIFENTPDLVVQTDWRGMVQYMNPAARRILGFTLNEPLFHRSFREFNTAATNARFAREITPTVRDKGVWVGEVDVLVSGGLEVPVNHMVIAHRDAQGRVARYSAVMRDITSEVLAREHLRIQTATLSSVIESIPAMVAVYGKDMQYRLVNSSFERWRNRKREFIIGRTALEVLGAEDFETSLPWATRALAGETVSYEKEFPGSEMRHISVSYIPLRFEDGRIDGLVGIAQDVTVHREKEVSLLQLSERDPLTGLLNRAGLERFLVNESSGSGAADIVVIYIDLDRFKPVNDTHGHAVGDDLLRQFGQRVVRIVRPTDAVSRVGGDEFAVVLRDVPDINTAESIADKIVEVAKRPFLIGELELSISASAGVARDASKEDGWKGLVHRADSKAYEAKAAGRGQRA